MMTKDMMIEMEHLIKKFPHTNERKEGAWKTAVADISLSGGRGRVCGLRGPTGARKPTCIHMPTMRTQPRSCSIRVGGEDIRAAERHVKAQSGVVPQHGNVDQ